MWNVKQNSPHLRPFKTAVSCLQTAKRDLHTARAFTNLCLRVFLTHDLRSVLIKRGEHLVGTKIDTGSEKIPVQFTMSFTLLACRNRVGHLFSDINRFNLFLTKQISDLFQD
jgi:hypothetical protein